MPERDKKGPGSPGSSGQGNIYHSLVAAGAFAATTRGEKLVARFCNAVAKGQTPEAADLQQVAEALSIFLDGKGYTDDRAVRVAKRLGITHKQGRQPGITFADLERYGRAVLEFQDLAAEVGEPDARRVICERHGIDRKTLRERVRKYGPKVDYLRQMDELVRRAMGASIPE